MTHPSFETMLRYAADNASDEELLEIDLHLADCPECYQQMTGLKYLHKNFAVVWDTFSLNEYAELQRQLDYISVLAKLAETHPEVKTKLKTLYSKIKEGLVLSAKLLLDSAQRLSLVALDSKKGPLSKAGFDLAPLFAGIEDVNQMEAGRELAKSREYLQCNMNAEAMELLNDVLKMKPELVESSNLIIRSRNQDVGDITVNSLDKTLEIRFWEYDRENPPLVAILTHLSGEETVIQMAKDENDHFIAFFENITEGISRFRVI